MAALQLSFFIKGAVLGFSIAAPVGPIGVLCIRRSLSDGTLAGLSVGLGAATADAAYGCIAAYGLTTISMFLVHQQMWLALFGGAFLCWLGIRTWNSKPPEPSTAAQPQGHLSHYGSTFLLTLTNPATILSFVAVFAGFGLSAARGYLASSMLVLGVFAGSAAWWILLSSSVGFFRTRVTPVWMQMINRLSGAVLVGLGLFAIVKASR